MAGTNKIYPARLNNLLENKGYFKISPEERLKKHEETLEKLKRVQHFNYTAGREALKELRGE